MDAWTDGGEGSNETKLLQDGWNRDRMFTRYSWRGRRAQQWTSEDLLSAHSTELYLARIPSLLTLRRDSTMKASKQKAETRL